ncbi:MAG: hypothetical protein ABW185_23075, partial [Sedimenticola sp.]
NMAGCERLLELEREDGESVLSLDMPVVNGYMFEPRRNQTVYLSDDSTSDDSSSDEIEREMDPRIGNNEW